MKILVKQSRVKINDIISKVYDTRIDVTKDVIKLDDIEVSYKKYIYIMLNKPQGVVCSTKDGLSPTVLSLVPDELMRKGLFPAGRLDKDTVGFVLITDDGELTHKMLAPKSHVPKLYLVGLKEKLESNYEERFQEGMMLASGEKCLPAELFPNEGNNKLCYVVLHEGMFHQIKRMFDMLGNEVAYLKRCQLGGLALDEKLELGACKEILHKDVEKLLERPAFSRHLLPEHVNYSSI